MEELEEWAQELRDSGKAVVVEGMKDRAALQKLFIDNIFTLNKPLFAIVEEISKEYEEVVILTDFDKKGKELYGKLRNSFKSCGIKVDTYFREFLQKNTKISHIEGIATYLQHIESGKIKRP